MKKRFLFLSLCMALAGTVGAQVKKECEHRPLSIRESGDTPHVYC